MSPSELTPEKRLELLRGYSALKENVFFQGFMLVVEQQLQAAATTASAPIFTADRHSSDGVTFLIAQQQAIGKVQGLSQVRVLLDTTIAALQEFVKADMESQTGGETKEQDPV